jgi:asparagine synthase (glutamine-hydrolysing)
MCGINGIFAYHYAANPVDRDELLRTRDYMTKRGPDGFGAWVSKDGRVGVGHRRLSIIDLSEAGAQPMFSGDGRLAVTFNGEIYNYPELRRDLEAKGRIFKSHSDTEVLLHLYAEKGEAMVNSLRGMFAFAIWDERDRKLFLARDPYGIKPLYYADDGWTFRFASQVKALVAGGEISKDPEPAGQVGFYLFGHVPEPFTTFQAVRALPAGTTLLVNSIGAHEPHRYHSISQVYCEAEAKGKSSKPSRQQAPYADIREALLDSVSHHLLADVPVGAFLSAGVDSSALVGLMRDAGQQDIQTVTLAFSEFQGRPEDEAPLAEKVARLYGTRHTTRVVTEAEFTADLPHILEAMDQPSIDGINTWFVSKAAHELGLKVAISGLGGDELFGGYPSFWDIPKWVSRLAVPSRIPLLGTTARWFLQQLGRALAVSPKAAGMIELGGSYAGAYLLRRGLFMPWELIQILDPAIVNEGLDRLAPLHLVQETLAPCPVSPFGRVLALESSLYMRNQLLRDSDWASMAHSLELRVPLVDSTLLKTVARHLPATTGVAAPKAALALSPSKPLPAEILSKPKTGFTTPIAKWLQNQALPAVRSQSRLQKVPKTAHWSRQWAARLAAA